MNELERLREMVRKRRSAVTAKIARIRRNTGVDITGRSEDPRRATDAIKRYNVRQLNNYLGELNAFQSRSVGYVAGAGGVPIPRNKWREYKRLEAQYNAIGAKHEASVADIFIPTSGMTIRQRKAMIHPTAVGEVVNNPYAWVEREPEQVRDAKSMDKLITDMRRRTDRKYLPGEIAKARKQLNEMLKTAGMNDVAKQASKLSNSQFDTLWNYTNFATQVSLSYELMKLRSADAKERWHDSVLEDARDDIGSLLEWANELPETQESGNQPSRNRKQAKKTRQAKRRR